MIPDIEPFEIFLSSLSEQPPADVTSWAEVSCVDAADQMYQGRRVKAPRAGFWHRTDGLQLTSVTGKLREELGRRKHLSDERLCRTILALFVRMKARPGDSAVTRMNALLDRIVMADLNQYLIFGVPHHPSLDFEVGPFHIGLLDAGRVHRQCERAGSDFAKGYAEMLATPRLALTRDHRSVAVLPCQSFADFKNLDRVYPLVDEYFHLLSDLHFRSLLDEFDRVQEMTKALGGGCFDTEKLMNEHGRSHLAIYLNVGEEKAGWVCNMRTGDQTLDFGGSCEAVPATHAMLREQFEIDDPDIGKLHPRLRSFFHFVGIARDHHSAGRLNEGFLHLVIALDLVFGEKDKSTASVSDRAAVLAHRGLEMELDPCRKLTRKIYVARSKYVHTGEQVSERDWVEASDLCGAVSFAMLRRFKQTGQRPVEGDNWLKRIDLVMAHHDSGIEVDEKVMKEIGVVQEGDFDHADYNRLLRKGDDRVNDLGRCSPSEFSFRG